MILTFTTPELIEFTRVYLAGFYTFVACFYTIKIIWMNKQQRRFFIFTGARFSDTWWNHIVFRIFRATIWLICVMRLFYPELDYFLFEITLMQEVAVIVTGCMFLTLGFAWTMAVHFYMGKVWRSGIDPQGPPKLITTGVYSYSRNPMFMGIMLAQLGFFLALPSVFSALCLVIGVVVLIRQSNAEERHLSQVFASKYQEYQARTPKWL
ncbi:methyltransferase family protein [Paraglaciecola aestuariivivens]